MINNKHKQSKIFLSDINFDKNFIDNGVVFDEKTNSSISILIERMLNKDESIDVVAQIIGKNIKCKLSYIYNLNERQYTYQINWTEQTKTSNYLKKYKDINYCNQFRIFGVSANKFLFESFNEDSSFRGKYIQSKNTAKKNKSAKSKVIDNRIFIKNRLLEIDFINSLNHLTGYNMHKKKRIIISASSNDLNIWKAFKNDKFKKLFEYLLLINDFSYNEASMMMKKFSEIVKDVSHIDSNKYPFDCCENFEYMQNIIENLFEFKYNSMYGSWVKYLFLAYLKYILFFYIKWNTINNSIFDFILVNKPIIKLKKIKIKLTNKFGKTEVLSPQEALRKVILLIGAENVVKMNIKVGNNKLILNYYHGLDKKYEQIDKWCWLYSHGSSAQKIQNINSMISKFNNIGIKAELIEEL